MSKVLSLLRKIGLITLFITLITSTDRNYIFINNSKLAVI
jgi:hypothetical protein